MGLDSVVGKGGCARAVVYCDKAEGEPLFRSKHLIGADDLADTGELSLDGAGGKTQLVLVAHPAHTDRPPGSDPFDIRDVVDWLEPQLTLDLGALRGEVHGRFGRLTPSLDDWKISDAEKDRIIWANRWDGANPFARRFHLEFRPAEASLTLKRNLHVEADQNWLLLYASRNADGNQTSPTELIVRINGKQVANFDVPPRWGNLSPLIVPLNQFHDRDVALEARFVTRGDKSFVDWRSMAVVDRLPNLAEVFETRRNLRFASRRRMPGARSFRRIDTREPLASKSRAPNRAPCYQI